MSQGFPPGILPATEPYLARQPLVFLKNDDATAMPAFAVAEITGITSHGGYQIWTVRQPTGGDDAVYAVNGPLAVAAGAVGAGHVGPIVQVLYDTGDGTPSGEWGPKNGQWSIGSAGTGFHIVGVRDLADGDVAEAVQLKTMAAGTQDAFLIRTRLNQDIIEGEAAASIQTAPAAVLSPSPYTNLPTVTTARNRFDMIASDADDCEITFDSTASEWFISSVGTKRGIYGVMSQNTGQTVTTGAAQAIQFATSEANDGITLDTAGNQFTTTTSGIYYVSCVIDVVCAAGGSGTWNIITQISMAASAGLSTVPGATIDLVGTTGNYKQENLQIEFVKSFAASANIGFTLSTTLQSVTIDRSWANMFLIRHGA